MFADAAWREEHVASQPMQMFYQRWIDAKKCKQFTSGWAAADKRTSFTIQTISLRCLAWYRLVLENSAKDQHIHLIMKKVFGIKIFSYQTKPVWCTKCLVCNTDLWC